MTNHRQMDLDGVVVDMWRDPEDEAVHVSVAFAGPPEEVHLHVEDASIVVHADGSQADVLL